MLPLVCRLNGLDNCSGYAEKPAATDFATNSFLDGPRPHRRRRHPAWRSCRHAGVLSALAEERGRVYQIGRDKAALPRGPRRGRPTARLRSRSEAEPSERDCEAGSRGRKTVPEYGGKANARRVADGIAMTTRPKRESPREAEEARETAATRCARATPDSGTASQEPTPPSAAGAPAHAPPPIPDRLRYRIVSAPSAVDWRTSVVFS